MSVGGDDQQAKISHNFLTISSAQAVKPGHLRWWPAHPNGCYRQNWIAAAHRAAGRHYPGDTLQAVLNLARNPSLSPAGLFALARTATVYQPALTAPPTTWILALLYTDTDLYASGRIAIDAKGNVWSNNNWLPGTKDPVST
jgi:hypothetical protein